MEINANLENWYLINNSVVGNIYNDKDKRWADGTVVITSSITSFEGDTVKTRNSVYKLGKKKSV